MLDRLPKPGEYLFQFNSKNLLPNVIRVKEIIEDRLYYISPCDYVSGKYAMGGSMRFFKNPKTVYDQPTAKIMNEWYCFEDFLNLVQNRYRDLFTINLKDLT